MITNFIKSYYYMLRRFDFLNQPPQIYIFHENANKTSFGGFIFVLFLLNMIFISILYIYDFAFNEKYEIEYSRYYSPITKEKRELLNSDPELNPKLSFILDGTYYIRNNYSGDFAFYDPLKRRFYYDVNHSNITKNVSEFNIELLYRCKSIEDDICSLREKDKNISIYETYFGFDFTYPTFILDHSKPNPFEWGHNISNNFLFNMNDPKQYNLFWNVIKYKNQKGISHLFDSWRGKKNEFKSGYIEEKQASPITPTYRFSLSFKYRVIGRIKIYNLHTDYEEYKRKDITLLTTLADIGALFVSIKGIIESVFSLYSNSFDNHKMVKNILKKNIKKNSENKDKNYELLPLDKDNNMNNIKNNLIVNETGDEPEKFDLRKISCIHYLCNNLYCKKLDLNVQESIETCNDIIQTYMSYECILYNQIMLENLLMDYNWNDQSLKELTNNNLIRKLQNLEIEYT